MVKNATLVSKNVLAWSPGISSLVHWFFPIPADPVPAHFILCSSLNPLVATALFAALIFFSSLDAFPTCRWVCRRISSPLKRRVHSMFQWVLIKYPRLGAQTPVLGVPS